MMARSRWSTYDPKKLAASDNEKYVWPGTWVLLIISSLLMAPYSLGSKADCPSIGVAPKYSPREGHMRHHLLCTSMLLLFCLSSAARADCAPPPPVFDDRKKIDTEGAIGKFLKLVGLNLHVDVGTEKKSIFSEYPNADQMVVALTTIYNICSNPQLSEEKKIELQVSIQAQFFTLAQGPQPISSTAAPRQNTAPPAPPDRSGRGKKSQWVLPVQLVSSEGASNEQNKPQKISWADIYLNPVPIFITDENKYFVIVGDALSEAEGKKKLSDLKSKYPAYDFELYAPYGSNKHYGIMIASWVSKERAAEALAAAKKIDRTSFIWSCRSKGDSC